MISFPCTHSAFEDQHPDELEAAKAYELNRQALHVSRVGSLGGYRPGREFPCPGILDIVDRHGPHWTVACSVCTFETTIRNPERARRERTLEEAKW